MSGAEQQQLEVQLQHALVSRARVESGRCVAACQVCRIAPHHRQRLHRVRRAARFGALAHVLAQGAHAGARRALWVIGLAAGEGEVESRRSQGAAARSGTTRVNGDIQRLAEGNVVHAHAALRLSQVLDGGVHQHPVAGLDAHCL